VTSIGTQKLKYYGCETWSVTLWEDHRLRVLEKRVLRKIFGCMREKVAGSWRRLHNEELVFLTKCYSGEKIKEDEIVGAYRTHGRDEKWIKDFGWKI
jgi:hypothetical protein